MSARRLCLVALAAVLVGSSSSAPAAVAATVPARGELVVNGFFDSGSTAPWWNSANTSFGVTGGQLRTTVSGGTVNSYDAMIGQSAIGLTGGRAYTLTFGASATAAVTVRVTVQLEAAPYTATLNQTVRLDPTYKHYTLPFTSSLTTATGQVTLQLGGAGAFTAALDEVSLTPAPTALTSGFYADPDSNSATWVRDHATDSRAAAIQASIASQAGARWFGGWSGDIQTAVSAYVGAADTAHRLPALVAYNIPDRDCNGESSGGAGSPDLYRTWITNFATGIGSRPAVVVLEPDAVAQSTLTDCMTGTERQTRLDLLRYAAGELRRLAPNTWTYLDGGNAGWIAADTMAQSLDAAGLLDTRGYAVNVSNYYTTATSTSYADAIDTALQTRYGYTTRYVVDTSRNGSSTSTNGEWCNPAGRKLGVTTRLGTGNADLLLWVKAPGDSDGSCGIGNGIPAGQFDPGLAMALITG